MMHPQNVSQRYMKIRIPLTPLSNGQRKQTALSLSHFTGSLRLEVVTRVSTQSTLTSTLKRCSFQAQENVMLSTTIWTSLQRSSGDSSLKISLFCGDLSTNQREPGSGGVQKGPAVAAKLYRLMFDYYTNVLNINNLIWVWNCPTKGVYPGDDFVDIVSMDIYLPEYTATDYSEEYTKLVEATSSNKVAALTEVGYIPDIHLLEKSHTPWAYYMTWSEEFCIGEKFNSNENLKAMYDSQYAVTGK